MLVQLLLAHARARLLLGEHVELGELGLLERALVARPQLLLLVQVRQDDRLLLTLDAIHSNVRLCHELTHEQPALDLCARLRLGARAPCRRERRAQRGQLVVAAYPLGRRRRPRRGRRCGGRCTREVQAKAWRARRGQARRGRRLQRERRAPLL